MQQCPAREYISKMVKQSRQWKVAIVAKDCSLSGKVATLGNITDQKQLILDVTKQIDFSNLKKST